MYCPIFINAMMQTGRTDVANETPCLQDECAWWKSAQKCCAVLDIAYNLATLSYETSEALHELKSESMKD